MVEVLLVLFFGQVRDVAIYSNDSKMVMPYSRYLKK